MHLCVLESACTALEDTSLTPLLGNGKTASFEWGPEKKRALLKIWIGRWASLLHRSNGLPRGLIWGRKDPIWHLWQAPTEQLQYTVLEFLDKTMPSAAENYSPSESSIRHTTRPR